MSDQAQYSGSKVPTQSEFSNEILYWNSDGRQNKMLMKDVPKLGNNDVYNGYDQGFTTTTSSQSLMLSSPEEIIKFKMEISIELNPIGSLQELCISRNYAYPIYKFAVDYFKEHDQRFIVKCLISHYISSGTASTKKGAKRKAAYEMYKQLENMDSENMLENIDNESESIDPIDKIVFSFCHESVTLLKTYFGVIDTPKLSHFYSLEKNSNKCKLTAVETLKIISKRKNFTVALNPIGSLQDLCLACHFPFPLYHFSVDNLKEHEPKFTVECLLSLYISSGTASTKKGAKQRAAYAMFKLIEKLASEDVHQLIYSVCEYNNASDEIVTSLCPPTYEETPGVPNILRYKSNESKLTAVDTLKMISEREHFTLRCTVIFENRDNVTVVMQANTSPAIEFSESGKNENYAKESAAHDILSYLTSKLRI